MLSYNLRPRIVIGDIEHHQLLLLAITGVDHPHAGDELVRELDRARVVPVDKVPPDVVRMGSQVTYQSDDGEVRTVELVYPGRADISAEKVLTPVGTALIGLRVGQSISRSARTGQKKVLTALSASPPAQHEDPEEQGRRSPPIDPAGSS